MEQDKFLMVQGREDLRENYSWRLSDLQNIYMYTMHR